MIKDNKRILKGSTNDDLLYQELVKLIEIVETYKNTPYEEKLELAKNLPIKINVLQKEEIFNYLDESKRKIEKRTFKDYNDLFEVLRIENEEKRDLMSMRCWSLESLAGLNPDLNRLENKRKKNRNGHNYFISGDERPTRMSEDLKFGELERVLRRFPLNSDDFNNLTDVFRDIYESEKILPNPYAFEERYELLQAGFDRDDVLGAINENLEVNKSSRKCKIDNHTKYRTLITLTKMSITKLSKLFDILKDSNLSWQKMPLTYFSKSISDFENLCEERAKNYN